MSSGSKFQTDCRTCWAGSVELRLGGWLLAERMYVFILSVNGCCVFRETCWMTTVWRRCRFTTVGLVRKWRRRSPSGATITSPLPTYCFSTRSTRVDLWDLQGLVYSCTDSLLVLPPYNGSHLIMHRTSGLYRTPNRNPNPSPLVHPI